MKKIYDIEAIKYISRICEGGMRDGISLLEKCMSYSDEITVESVVNALGISNYDDLNNLLTNLLQHKTKEACEIVENVYNQGKDLKVFIKQFIQYLLDVCKYLLYKNYDYIQIPNTIDLSVYDEHDYNNLLELLDTFIYVSNEIKYDQNPKVLIESKILILR